MKKNFVFNESTEVAKLQALELARSGSGSQLGRLLETFRPQLMQVAERSLGTRLRSRMSMSDLVQDTMLTASHQFPSFRGASERELESWLLEVLRSRLADGLRKHLLAEKRRQGREVHSNLESLPDDTTSSTEQMEAEEETERLLTALGELPTELRTLVRMRYLEDLTFDQIAQRLDISTTTVWRRWLLALQKLKYQLHS